MAIYKWKSRHFFQVIGICWTLQNWINAVYLSALNVSINTKSVNIYLKLYKYTEGKTGVFIVVLRVFEINQQ